MFLSLIRTRLSCRPALPFLLPPFPRPGPRPCSGKHGRPTWTSAANGIGWAWARRSSNGWPSMAAPSSQSLAAAARQPAGPGGHRHPALGAAHDHRHAGPVRRDQARARIHELADLAQKFGTLSYPSNAAGFYFPVEIDPTYTAAPADFGAIWSKLPRPCTCRSTTAPASTTRPPRNGWTHSSPGRDHPVPGRRGRTRRDAAAGAGPLRPDPRATPEDRDDRRGLPSESHARRRLLHSRHGGRIPSAAAGLCAPGSGARLRRPQLPGRSADPAHRRRGARPAADSVERARQQLGRRAAGLATRQRRVGGGGEIPRRDPGRHGRASVAPL